MSSQGNFRASLLGSKMTEEIARAVSDISGGQKTNDSNTQTQVQAQLAGQIEEMAEKLVGSLGSDQSKTAQAQHALQNFAKSTPPPQEEVGRTPKPSADTKNPQKTKEGSPGGQEDNYRPFGDGEQGGDGTDDQGAQKHQNKKPDEEGREQPEGDRNQQEDRTKKEPPTGGKQQNEAPPKEAERHEAERQKALHLRASQQQDRINAVIGQGKRAGILVHLQQLRREIKETRFDTFLLALVVAITKDSLDVVLLPFELSIVMTVFVWFFKLFLSILLFYLCWGKSTYFKNLIRKRVGKFAGKHVKKYFTRTLAALGIEQIPIINILLPMSVILIVWMNHSVKKEKQEKEKEHEEIKKLLPKASRTKNS